MRIAILAAALATSAAGQTTAANADQTAQSWALATSVLGGQPASQVQSPQSSALAGAGCYDIDDGLSNDSIGLVAGGELAWMTGFNANGGSDVITEISTTFGSTAGATVPANQPVEIAIWDDPTNDMDPTDAVLVFSVAGVSANENSDTFNAYAIPSVAVSGVFFIGVSINGAAGEFPAPLDLDSAAVGQTWVVGSTLGPDTLDLTNLTANDVPPLDLGAIGFPGAWMLQAEGTSCGPLGQNYCTANGNSVSASGSIMSLAGSDSLAVMDLTLNASNAPAGQPGLFFYGPNQVNAPLGCGQICIGGSLVRLPVVFENAGTYSFDVDFGVSGTDFATLGTVNFQCWYRDPANSGACGDTFNLSDGIEITFMP